MVDANTTGTAPAKETEVEKIVNIIEVDAHKVWRRIEAIFADFNEGKVTSVDTLKDQVHEAAESQAPAGSTPATLSA